MTTNMQQHNQHHPKMIFEQGYQFHDDYRYGVGKDHYLGLSITLYRDRHGYSKPDLSPFYEYQRYPNYGRLQYYHGPPGYRRLYFQYQHQQYPPRY